MLAIAGLIIVATWATLWMRFREQEPVEPPTRPDVRVWDVPGCYRVSAEPWPEPDDAPPLPELLYLVADSVDEYGREQETYRASVLGPTEAGAEYRWFVRADTLWLVWSDADAGLRGGLAMRTTADGLLGRARVTGSDGSPDMSARTRAWRVNCATGEIEEERALRR